HAGRATLPRAGDPRRAPLSPGLGSFYPNACMKIWTSFVASVLALLTVHAREALSQSPAANKYAGYCASSEITTGRWQWTGSEASREPYASFYTDACGMERVDFGELIPLEGVDGAPAKMSALFGSHGLTRHVGGRDFVILTYAWPSDLAEFATTPDGN